MKFFKSLETFKNSDLYEYRFIILEYVYGDFIILNNEIEKKVFIKNKFLSKSNFFSKKFRENKYIYKIPKNIKIYDKYIELINLLYSNDIFYFNCIKKLLYYEFKQLIVLFNYLDLLKLDKNETLLFYNNMIEITYTTEFLNYDNLEIGYLLKCDF